MRCARPQPSHGAAWTKTRGNPIQEGGIDGNPGERGQPSQKKVVQPEVGPCDWLPTSRFSCVHLISSPPSLPNSPSIPTPCHYPLHDDDPAPIAVLSSAQLLFCSTTDFLLGNLRDPTAPVYHFLLALLDDSSTTTAAVSIRIHPRQSSDPTYPTPPVHLEKFRFVSIVV